MWASKKLSGDTKVTLATMMRYMNKTENGAWRAHPSERTLAELTGRHARAIIRHIGKAEEQGWLTVCDYRGRGRGWRKNEYEMRYPPAQGGDKLSLRPKRRRGDKTGSDVVTKLVNDVVTNCHPSIKRESYQPTYQETGGVDGGLSSENQTQNHPAIEGETQTTPGIGEESLKETSGKLGRFIVNVAAKTGRKLSPPRRKELVALERARQEHGDEVWGCVLWNFAERPEGFDGVHSPWSLLLSQMDTAIAAAVRELQLEVEEERRKEEAKPAWRCPEPNCGGQAVEDRIGRICHLCRRPVDEAKVGEWRERVERERVEQERNRAELEKRMEAARSREKEAKR
jgi:hypothetical protein